MKCDSLTMCHAPGTTFAVLMAKYYECFLKIKFHKLIVHTNR